VTLLHIILDQKMDIPFCPIVKPTVKEFSNFSAYMNKLENEYSSE